MRLNIKTKSTVAHFSRAAAEYTTEAVVQRRVVSRLCRMLQEECSPDSILELGCGTGLLTSCLVSLFSQSRITAVDISEGMIEQARCQLSGLNVTFKTIDVRELPVEPAYDLIISASALHWMTPLDVLCQRLRGMYRGRGRFYAALMIDGTLKELHRARVEVAPHKPPIWGFPKALDVEQALVQSGFTICSMDLVPFYVNHNSAFAFFKSLHRLGVNGGNSLGRIGLLSRSEIERVAERYEYECSNSDGGVFARYMTCFVDAVI